MPKACPFLTAAFVVFAVLAPLPAYAQHTHDGSAASTPAPTPANPAGMDHSAMGHSAMDHSAMDHSGMDHSAMGNAAMGQAMMMGPLLSGAAEGSGTARLPASEGMMPGVYVKLGRGWSGMAHGYLWGIYTNQTGPRGDDLAYAQSMAMLMAEHRTDTLRIQLRAMLSAEPQMGARGYPNLFATGETADGEPLVDRQHPHDLFMELAGRVEARLGDGLAGFVYGGPVGEPALGPPAFMHRASARMNPEAPITHHWFDSTHITYGVITAGLAGHRWQAELSAFRGQEPDEDRWEIETPRLDSWATRITLNPSANWAFQLSHGRLEQPELQHPGEDEARSTASVHYNSGHGLAVMAAASAKNRLPGSTLTAVLGEANWDVSRRHTVFARYENVANDELFPGESQPLQDRTFRVAKLQGGYAYTLPLGAVAGLSLGGSVATFFKPRALDPAYGSDPMGYTLFARLALGRR